MNLQIVSSDGKNGMFQPTVCGIVSGESVSGDLEGSYMNCR